MHCNQGRSAAYFSLARRRVQGPLSGNFRGPKVLGPVDHDLFITTLFIGWQRIWRVTHCYWSESGNDANCV